MADQTSGKRHAGALIFTGHMVDAPDRQKGRFPPTLEPLAAAEIDAALGRLAAEFSGDLIAFASVARGGDVLFIEACLRRGIAIYVVLPFGREAFAQSSIVGVPSGDWLARYNRALEALGAAHIEVMNEPVSDTAFEACNNRLVERASALGQSIVLLALLENGALEKTGGSAAFAASVQGAGGRVELIDVKALRDRLGL